MRRLSQPLQACAYLATAGLTLAALSLAVPQDPAAGPWTHQAPLPTGLDLRDVHVLSGAEAWAIGDQGLLLHTLDGGQTWAGTSLPSTSTWTVFFLDPQRGWAAGNGFFHTLDGGQTWVQDSSWGSIYDIRFLDAQRGWACGNGGTTYRTTDGGLTWNFATVGPITTLRSIQFVDANRGFTVNINGDIFESSDGGQSWSLNFTSGGSNLNTVVFFDAQEGWAIGGSTFLHTLDGAQTWQSVTVPANTWVYSAAFSDRLHGWGVGEGGSAVRTLDGGQTWSLMNTSVSGPRLWGVHFSDSQTGMLVGETGVLSRSTDGGATWASLQSGGTGFTHGLDALDAQHAWAANDAGEVLRTTDGVFWQRHKIPDISIYGRVQDVDFTDLQSGWAVGDDGSFPSSRALVARSTDGGVSWVTQYTDGASSIMEAVEAIDSQRAVAVGNRSSSGGFVLRTSNGGASWQDVSPSAATYMDVDFADSLTGWIVGGAIYRTDNGGSTWQLQATPSSLLESVSFADTSSGWAVGWQGRVLRTTDGGQTWTSQNVPGKPTVFLAIQAVSPDGAWLVGSDRTVRRTVDGGQTWTSEVLSMANLNVLEALSFIDAENGWVGGTPYAPGGGIWRRAGCAPGEVYCVAGTNSTGAGASISHQGSLSVAANDFVVTSTGCPTNQFGLFFHGQGRTQLPLGDGFLCVGTNIKRLLVVKTDLAGAASFPLDFGGIPKVGGAITAGSTWGFQFWYRDPGFGTGFNFSDALEVTFCP